MIEQISNIEEQLIKLNNNLNYRNKEISRLKEELIIKKKENKTNIEGLIKLIDKIDEIRVFCEKTKKVEMLNIINNIIKKMKYDLREIGVEEIPSYGELFNSNLHECLQVVNKPDTQKDEIVEVIRRGYYYNGSVLRNSLVIIGE